MGKTLVICESRTLADAISRALGDSFVSEPTRFEGSGVVLTWTAGRIAQLAGPEVYDPALAGWRLEDLPIVPERFLVVARTESESAKEQLKAIRALVRRRDVERLVNACEPGPDGELTFSLVRELVDAGDLPVERAWLECRTRACIRAAFAQLRPGAAFRPLEEAARARAEADWLVGVNGTRAATVRARALGGRTTLGRALTPALAALVEREQRIEAFVPRIERVVVAAFEPASGSARFLGRLVPRAREGQAGRDAVLEHLRGAPGVLRTVRLRTERRRPPLLHDLRALQREAAQRHGFGAARTLNAAWECYEQGVLTHPCAASRYLAAGPAAELREIAGHVGRAAPGYRAAAAFVQGLDELPLERVVGEHGREEHPALRPTDAKHDLSALGEDARSVYDMVACRFLAAFHPPAVLERRSLMTEIDGERFLSRGHVLLERGWYAAYGETPPGQLQARDDGLEQQLGEWGEGDEVHCARIEARERAIGAPARFDDVSLLEASSGAVGPAAIERLIELGYATRVGRSLAPTARGAGVIDLLGDHEITRLETLRSFEARLAELAAGGAGRADLLRDAGSLTRDLVEHLRALPDERTHFPRRDLGIVCPRCGSGTLIENRKGFGCSTWSSREEPGCGFVIWKSIAGRQIGEEVVRELVAKGRTGELRGFRSRAGRPFAAALALDPAAEQPVTLSFEPRRGARGRTRA